MTIERNLGNVERVIRLVLGLCLITLAFTSPALNGIEWFVGIVSVALIMNGIFSRCYLWYVLDVTTAATDSADCATNRVS